jgi:hypothetical protein
MIEPDMPEQTKSILVTIGGECFEAEFQASGPADGRDGFLDYFRLNDLVKDRGVRSVVLFQSGTDRATIKDYDARVETVRLNVLRRAFDSGTFSFETTIPRHHYHELPLRAADFQPQKKASDETIRRFIKLGAYYLGFKYHPQAGPNLYVDFDCPVELDYLGVKSDDLGRNVWLLTEQGYLRSSAATLANPLRVSPTEKLITDIENGDDPKSSLSLGATVTNIYHLYGANPRVNNQSTDNSVNITTVSGDQLFAQLREAAHSITNEPERHNILTRLEELEKAQGSDGFVAAYQSFIASAAQYMTILGPFIPALTQMLSGK